MSSKMEADNWSFHLVASSRLPLVWPLHNYSTQAVRWNWIKTETTLVQLLIIRTIHSLSPILLNKLISLSNLLESRFMIKSIRHTLMVTRSIMFHIQKPWSSKSLIKTRRTYFRPRKTTSRKRLQILFLLLVAHWLRILKSTCMIVQLRLEYLSLKWTKI